MHGKYWKKILNSVLWLFLLEFFYLGSEKIDWIFFLHIYSYLECSEIYLIT